MSLSNITLLVVYSELFLEEEKCKMSRAPNPQIRLHQTTIVINLYSGKVLTESLLCKK